MELWGFSLQSSLDLIGMMKVVAKFTSFLMEWSTKFMDVTDVNKDYLVTDAHNNQSKYKLPICLIRSKLYLFVSVGVL